MSRLKSETIAIAGVALLLLSLRAVPLVAQSEEEPTSATEEELATEGEEMSERGEAGEGDGSELSDEERATMALDSTATQWSFQFAWQVMPDYYDDELDDGSTRSPGNTDFLQLRIVAPVPLKSFTILPRVTLRHYESPAGESGLGNTEIFALMIPKSWDWGSGRTGIGPLVTLPGSTKVSKDEWGYGLAGGLVNGSGKWFYGVLLTQSWQAIDPNLELPPGQTDTNPLGIAPFLNYKLPRGWYVSNGDMVIQYDWDSSEWYVPIAVRLGKVIVKPKQSYNIYGEYRTSLVYESWGGSAVENSYRINFTYSIPVM
jgi:hypothetical protein